MIDLRSDTVTKPTDKMRQASLEAEVGDDVYGEDPTIKKLEAKAAEITGKEAALFVTSGTQGNQLAVLTHTRPGQEMILEEDAHIYKFEGAAISALAGVQPRPIKGTKGAMNPEDLEAAIRPDDIHFPETGMIGLENTHNQSGGTILPLENMKEVYEMARRNQVPVHLDGARLFNASVASGISVQTYASYTDTVQFCLSKGLGAPIGSIIAGSKDFIQRARKWRKRLGGGLRQAGIIAAPGMVALTDMVDRLAEDHKNAKNLAQGFDRIDGLNVENDVETNIIVLNVKGTSYTASEFVERLKERGILAGALGPDSVRLVTHLDVTSEDIETALTIIKGII
ncbi:low-specificity L-threonine aldolase [Virgibacillus sp. MSP4-1]|uniref:low-specificity L-threonine aldolase n=1 Tax=Virgibacillus sp. MSP4-1 TaxID=2700081 RepID=UPI000399E5E7|nr:low-specificity L-threonine aldolase [Virgibacillus sp. MSP4-1]QHS23659.1 low-specificity L-threonine aldolase [Virgibacillus sp. MSP4-1]